MNSESGKWKTVRLGDVISKADIMRNKSQNYPILSMTMHEGLIFQKDRFSKQIASIDRSNYLVVKSNQLVQSFPNKLINLVKERKDKKWKLGVWKGNDRQRLYGEINVDDKSLNTYDGILYTLEGKKYLRLKKARKS